MGASSLVLLIRFASSRFILGGAHFRLYVYIYVSHASFLFTVLAFFLPCLGPSANHEYKIDLFIQYDWPLKRSNFPRNKNWIPQSACFFLSCFHALTNVQVLQPTTTLFASHLAQWMLFCLFYVTLKRVSFLLFTFSFSFFSLIVCCNVYFLCNVLYVIYCNLYIYFLTLLNLTMGIAVKINE